MWIARRTVALCLLVGCVVNSDAQEKKSAPLPKEITWKLDELNKDPLKVVTTEFVAKQRAIYWVIELTRDFTLYEDQAYWGPAFRLGKQPRFRFELQDRDGIVLKVVDAMYVGEYVHKAGKRFGAYFVMPPDVTPLVRTVIAVQP